MEDAGNEMSTTVLAEARDGAPGHPEVKIPVAVSPLL
jgi:hypothetical protein